MERQQRDHQPVAKLPGAGKSGSVRRGIRLSYQRHACFEQDVAVDEPMEF
jgi:hypothetical protein